MNRQMTKKTMLMGALCALFAISACEAKKTEEPTGKDTTTGATTAAATPTATTVALAQPVTIDDKDLSTPADFEEAAEKDITKTTYKKELAALETSISAPPTP